MEGNLIKSVSVEINPESGKEVSVICWDTPSGLPEEATGYVIYEYTGDVYCTNEIARVNNRNASCYTYEGILLQGFTMAIDDGTANLPIVQRHATPYITAALYNDCNYSLQLVWTAYNGWEESAVNYRILSVINGKTELIADNISALSYTWNNLPDNTEIGIYIQAVKTDNTLLTSNSPRTYINTTTLRRPAYINLSQLTFLDQRVSLQFNIDPHTDLSTFKIQRSAGENFETRYTFADKTLASYSEDNIDAIFQYRLIAQNHCDTIARISNMLQNFMPNLTVTGNNWQIQWNEAQIENQFSYTLKRQKPQPEEWITNINGHSYEGYIPSMREEQSLEICYELQAADHLAQAVSTSRSCNIYIPAISMPDAIDPLGNQTNLQTGRARNMFGPVINAHPLTYRYHLEIINSNGVEVADITKEHDDNPLEKSWNGRLHNGNMAPEAVYIYHLEVDFEGTWTQKLTGRVTVMYQ